MNRIIRILGIGALLASMGDSSGFDMRRPFPGRISRSRRSGSCALRRQRRTLRRSGEKPFDYEGQYIGHDKPCFLFSSNTPGSGNSNMYRLTLPKDPPTQPKQDGTAAALTSRLTRLSGLAWPCVTPNPRRSSPETSRPIAIRTLLIMATQLPAPITSATIRVRPSWKCSSIRRVGFPGPPGVSCDVTKWCAALNIDGFLAGSGARCQQCGLPGNSWR